MSWQCWVYVVLLVVNAGGWMWSVSSHRTTLRELRAAAAREAKLKWKLAIYQRNNERWKVS